MLLSDLPLEVLTDILKRTQTEKTKIGYSPNDCVVHAAWGLKVRLVSPEVPFYLVSKALCSAWLVCVQDELVRVRNGWFYTRAAFSAARVASNDIKLPQQIITFCHQRKALGRPEKVHELLCAVMVTQAQGEIAVQFGRAVPNQGPSTLARVVGGVRNVLSRLTTWIYGPQFEGLVATSTIFGSPKAHHLVWSERRTVKLPAEYALPYEARSVEQNNDIETRFQALWDEVRAAVSDLGRQMLA